MAADLAVPGGGAILWTIAHERNTPMLVIIKDDYETVSQEAARLVAGR